MWGLFVFFREMHILPCQFYVGREAIKNSCYSRAQTGNFLMCSCSAFPAGPGSGIRNLQWNCWVERGSKVKRESDLAKQGTGNELEVGGSSSAKRRGQRWLKSMDLTPTRGSCAPCWALPKGCPAPRAPLLRSPTPLPGGGWKRRWQSRCRGRFPQREFGNGCSDTINLIFKRWLHWEAAGAAGTLCKDQVSSVRAGN